MEIVVHDPVIEEVLSTWRPSLGASELPYRGHVYRVLNIARRLLGTPVHDPTLAVVAVFHDLGIWSDQTFDYLGPSIQRAREHVRTSASDLDAELLALAIDNHHRLRALPRAAQEAGGDVVEMFRRADLVDVSGAWLRSGLERSFLRELRVAFPYAGFHRLLLRTGLSWFCKHPQRPLPMLRF